MCFKMMGEKALCLTLLLGVWLQGILCQMLPCLPPKVSGQAGGLAGRLKNVVPPHTRADLPVGFATPRRSKRTRVRWCAVGSGRGSWGVKEVSPLYLG